jgi:chemotaxis protein histidine kinase CheA
MDYTKIKIKAIAVIFFCCYAVASCFSNIVKAENVITGNILPNAGNSVSSYNSGTTPVISDNTSDTTMSNNTTLDGFAITCDTANGQNGGCGAFFTYDKAVEAAHDLKITSTATLVGIDGTGQTSSDTITSTVDKLDNGITLDSTIDMQNCEWSGSAFACGDSTGAADSYTVNIRILDSSDEELAAVTQTRTNDAGYYANSETFTNQLIYTGTGASKYEWSWNGVDGSGSTSTHANQRGPNLLGAKLLMTFDSEDYVRISTESQTALTSVETTFAELEETFAEAVSVVAEDPVTFSMEIEEETSFEETFSFEEEVFEETFSFEEESFEEESFEEPVVEEEPMEEEIYEEAEEVETSFVPTTSEEEEVVSEEEESFEESTMEPTQEEETVAEEEETVAEEEEVASEEEEQVEEESTEVVEETNEEEAEEETQEEESTSETATASTVSSKKSAKQKKIRSKKSLMANMERMMDKVDEDVKDIAKNMALKNIIKIKAMASEQASLDLYKNAIFYKPKDIYLEQLNIFDNRQIYANVSLTSYIKTDKVAIKANALHEINLKKQRLLIELEQLKNGKI